MRTRDSSTSTSPRSKRTASRGPRVRPDGVRVGPFEARVLEAAKAAVDQYMFTATRGEEGYEAGVLELPGVLGLGPTAAKAINDARAHAVTVVGALMEIGETPPGPASAKRDQQVNIRLSADEKFRMETAAARAGFRSLSDFLRAAGLDRAGRVG